MTLRDMLESYAEHARKAPGLHYVPSFNNNDLFTQDDLIAIEEEASSSSLAAAPLLESPATPGGAGLMMRHSNKPDDWPQFDSARDLHKVNVYDRTRDASKLFDNAKSGSVWEEIIKGEKLKQSSFKSLDRNNDGYLSTTEILQGFRTTREKAAQMIREADKDSDGRVSQDEYQDMLSRFGSE